MDEINNSINKKTIIPLSRITPVALVVGAAGFLGSNLVDKLLEIGIQVVGLDDLSSGKKENLESSSKNKNFHLVIGSAEDISLDLTRLDYLFIVSERGWDLQKMLNLFKTSKCRLLFVSSIDLYDKEKGSDLAWFKNAESAVAKYAKDYHLNARVLRLGAIFGPRMHFRAKDPLIRLIQASLSGDLPKDISLEFSTRSLYVSDAVDLIIKTIFSGATAQKIFDGVLPSPIKVEEIKQILLDPLWYESKNFTPAELPPWRTPNLEQTVKLLNWHPKIGIVKGLRATLNYFKDNEIKVPELEDGRWKMEDGEEDSEWKRAKIEQLAGLKKQVEGKKEIKKGISLPKVSLPLSKIYFLAAILLITYALIWPIAGLSWGILTFRYQLSNAAQDLEKGEFDKSLSSIKQATFGVERAKSIFESLEPIRTTGMLGEQFQLGDNLSGLATQSVVGIKSTVLGIQALFQGLQAVTGESSEGVADYFVTAQVQLSMADENLAKAQALLSDHKFLDSVPKILSARVSSLKEKLLSYVSLIKKARALSLLLPQVVALDGHKTYLILLQNNMELRPGGGFIGSFAKVSFEGGKLKKLEVNDIYNIDGQLNIHVEPPKEIKEDLGQKDWFLRDSNWESDFPTAAKQAEWFYTKETQEKVFGVVALDISAMENLLQVVGPLNLSDYNEKITSENLFEKAISYAESSFFAGSQAKKNFLTALTHELFNKIFFLPKQNWPGIVTALGQALEGKHMSVFLDDPKLFSYLVSQNWTNVLPRPSNEKDGPFQDFLAPVEANLGANKVNYYLDRSYNLETIIGKEGEIKHRLRITYLNRSPSDAWPAGKYKNRLRIYLPFGTKMRRVLWGETNVTHDVTSFVDFGRSGYSLLLELLPKEQKILVLDYEIPGKIEFKQGSAIYRLDIVKQAGTLKDPLNWKLSFPLNYQIVLEQTKAISPQEQTISTDLSKDRSFVVEFKK